MANATPEPQQSKKNYSLQQINNGDNRKESHNCIKSIKQGTKEGVGEVRPNLALFYFIPQRPRGRPSNRLSRPSVHALTVGLQDSLSR